MDPGRTSGRVWLRSSAEIILRISRSTDAGLDLEHQRQTGLLKFLGKLPPYLVERFTDRNGSKQEGGPIGIGSSHSDSWPIRASGSSAKGVRFTSKDGLLPASTKRRTEAANVIGLKSWHVNSVCSATAPMATSPKA